MQLVAQRHGCTLTTVGLRLHIDVTKADVQFFLSCCHHLLVLMLKCGNKDLLEDVDITCISDYCPQLRLLGLLHCYRLTADGILYAIRNLDKLEKLNVQGCQALSNLLVPASIQLTR